MGHLPISKEGVPAGSTDVQAEALHDHAMKGRTNAHADPVAPEDFRELTRQGRVLLGTRPRDKCLAGTLLVSPAEDRRYGGAVIPD